MLALVAEGEIRGDAEEPRAGPVIALDLGEVLPGAQEGLLGEVVGDLLLVGQPPEIGEDLALVLAEDGLVGAQIGGLGVGGGALCWLVGVPVALPGASLEAQHVGDGKRQCTAMPATLPTRDPARCDNHVLPTSPFC
jgi:hypothetical protein